MGCELKSATEAKQLLNNALGAVSMSAANRRKPTRDWPVAQLWDRRLGDRTRGPKRVRRGHCEV